MKQYEPMMKLKLRRIEMGYTQESLAKTVGISQNMLRNRCLLASKKNIRISC